MHLEIRPLAQSILLIFSLTESLCATAGSIQVPIGQFSANSIEQWEAKQFKGQTAYQLSKLEDAIALKADSKHSASGLVKKQMVDLTRTPILNWRWRIENRLAKRDEQSKAGDDYAARVYVIISGGLAFWRTKAINYVWASSSPQGKIWPNAYAGDHAMMIALRSEQDKTGVWQSEKRNVLADIRQFYGDKIKAIDAIAIMTDTDDGGGAVTAYYGDIFFTAD
jgi:hypothetical protein